MPVFELACAAVVAVTCAVMVGVHGRRVLADYAILAIAGWIGEQTCIAAYDHYAYDRSWHLFIGHVPLLIPLIWPLVILSARDVAGALGASGVWRPLVAGAVVAFDAALVEVIAVGAGLWSWAEPGHLGVPVIGILGWGFFATAAVAWLDRRAIGVRLAAIIAAPLATHAALIASWWGLFRWVLRGDLGAASVAAIGVLGAALGGGALWLRGRGFGLGPAIAVPRIAAASLFFALLAAVSTPALWICAAASALPYLLLTRA